jgi:hypothetical protein
MRASFAFAFGFALLVACAPGSRSPQYTTDGGLPAPIGGGGGSLGDGGADAGDAGIDAGADAGDAGCVGVSFVTAYVTDTCMSAGTPVATTATVFVDPTTCGTTVNVGDGLICSGKASTASNAFDGGCGSGATPCTSPSIPGTITCTTIGTATCSVRICDTAGHCPP